MNACVDTPAEQESSQVDADGLDTGKVPRGGFPRRSRFARGLGVLFLALALAVVAFLGSAVPKAPFQLSLKTNFVGFDTTSDLHFRFSVSDWELRGARVRDATLPSGDGPVVLRRAPRDSAPARPHDTLDVWIRRGSEVVLHREHEPGAAAVINLNLTQPATVAIQFGTEAAAIEVTDSSGGSSVHQLTGGIEAEIGGGDRVSAAFTATTTGEDIGDRFFVSHLGFGRPGEDGVVRTGVKSGSLHFLYKPLEEIKLFRGTDLRFSEVDAEISAVALAADGIEVSGSGLVGSATLHSRSSSETAPRSVMPLRYDWLTADPWLIGALAMIGFVSGALGLAFTSLELFLGLSTLIAGRRDE